MAEEQRHIRQDTQGSYIEKADHVHFFNYGDKKIRKILNTPPFLSEEFIGREADIKAVEDNLQSGRPLLLVNGEGGIGKTTLAAHYYHKHRSNYKHMAWVFAETSLLDALLGLGPALADLSLSSLY
ncbi:MAG: ATP-binding protein [Methylococcales bacterium]|nr:ATP-binding protein [Methylococcales bacterium]